MTTNLDNVTRLHMQGKRYFLSGFFAEAERFYLLAVQLGGDHYKDIASLKFDLANAWQMMCRFEAATRFYEELLDANTSGEWADLARQELAKLQTRRRQWQIPQDVEALTADDQRFLDIAKPMLVRYPALVRPVHITWIDESERSLRRVQQIQQDWGVHQEDCLTSLTGWEALGMVVGYWHLVMIKLDWRGAKDSALRGLLAHELAHVELKDTFKERFIDSNQSQLAFICNERTTDLLAVSKGYGPDLIESRKFTERVKGPQDDNPSLTTPKELERLIREQHSPSPARHLFAAAG